MSTTPTAPAYPATPNLDKMLKVKDESQPLGEFVEWLYEQGWQVAKYGPVTQTKGCPGPDWLSDCEGGTIRPGTHRERTCPTCKGTGEVEVTYDGWQPYSKRTEDLLGEYFEIDTEAASKERDAVYRHMVAMNEARDAAAQD